MALRNRRTPPKSHALATFLSGGIDSPLITAIAKHKNPKLEAFTVSVEDKTLDESESAQA